MENRNFYAALVQLSDFYGISMKEDMFETVGLHAWDQIGNKNIRTYSYETKIVNNQVALPCNADILEAVLTGCEDYTTGENGDFNRETENYIETAKVVTEFSYESGSYLDYERDENVLHFKVTDVPVRIIYKGVVVDKDGLPLLNFKEIDAIAKYCAFIHLQKQAFITKDQASAQLALMMKQQWQFAVDDARTPLFLNQNDIDNLLNVQSSWDRKRFGLSFKAIR